MKSTLLILLCVMPLQAIALSEKDIATIDVGGGVPTMLAIEASVIPLKRLHLGVGYGLFPGVATGGLAIKLKGGNTATLINGTFIRLDPHLDHTFSSLSPFVRYFPNESGFYVQAMLSMFYTKSSFTNNLRTIFGEDIEGGNIYGSINNTILMPTLSIGHLLKKDLFFLNVNIGLTYIYDISSTMELSATIPDSYGGASNNQSALTKLQNELGAESTKELNRYREDNKFIPSFTVAIGMYL